MKRVLFSVCLAACLGAYCAGLPWRVAGSGLEVEPAGAGRVRITFSGGGRAARRIGAFVPHRRGAHPGSPSEVSPGK